MGIDPYETRFRITGDKNVASTYVEFARKLMDFTIQQTKIGGLSQYSQRKTLPNGVYVEADYRFGQRTITINVPPITSGGKPVENTDTIKSRQLIVVGQWTPSPNQYGSGNRSIWLWSPGTAAIDINPDPTLFSTCYAPAISKDGNFVAFGASDPAHVSYMTARWSKKHTDIINDLYAQSISYDGGVIVGYTHAGVAAYWTPTGGVLTLSDVAGDSTGTTAMGVSGDGKIAVGHSYLKSDANYSARPVPTMWVVGSGTETRLPLPDGYPEGIAYRASEDGSVIAGYVEDYTSYLKTACVWINGNCIIIGPLYSAATSVSHDGKIVTGWFNSGNFSISDGCFQWSNKGGYQQIYLQPAPSAVQRCTWDGTTIVGGDYANGPIQFSGMSTPWYWDLSTPKGRQIITDPMFAAVDAALSAYDATWTERKTDVSA